MKTAFITGGSKGIGLAICEMLCQNGWCVVITYLNDKDTAEQVTNLLNIKYQNSKVIPLRVDCSDINSINLISDFLEINNLFLDVVIFNSGLTDRSSFEDLDILNWKKVFDTNLNFPVFFLKQQLPKLNKNTSVIFTSSLMGIQPHSLSLSYGVSKASVNALVKNLVKFLAPYDIRVNAVAPGFVNTEWQKEKPLNIKNNIKNKISLGRFCEPSELVNVYLMLIENQYINGEIISVDGGYGLK